MKYVLLVLALVGCTSDHQYTQHPIKDQIIRARHGFLTNQYCTYLDPKHDCVLKSSVYDLNDVLIRKALVDARFVCDAGGRRFRICSDQPGICRFNGYKTIKRFLGIPIKRERDEEFIPQGDRFDTLSVVCKR